MDRVLTVPNLITLIRFLCIPVFIYLVYGPANLEAAAWLLAALGATDWVDGWYARRFDQVSTLGKVFDPTVDRLMLAVAAVVVIEQGAAPLWFGLVALGREVVVILGAIVIYFFKHAARIEVQFVGKTGALLLMMSLPLFLGSISTLSWREEARWAAWILGVPGLVFSWYSLGQYFPLARDALARGRARARA